MRVKEDFGEEDTKLPKRKKQTKKQIADQWYENNKDNIDWESGFNRQKFRETSHWQNFVKRVKKSYCEASGLKGKLSLHHLDEGHYDDLDPAKFRTLGWAIHKIIHQIDRKRDKSKVPEFWLQFCPSNYSPKDN